MFWVVAGVTHVILPAVTLRQLLPRDRAMSRHCDRTLRAAAGTEPGLSLCPAPCRDNMHKLLGSPQQLAGTKLVLRRGL